MDTQYTRVSREVKVSVDCGWSVDPETDFMRTLPRDIQVKIDYFFKNNARLHIAFMTESLKAFVLGARRLMSTVPRHLITDQDGTAIWLRLIFVSPMRN